MKNDHFKACESCAVLGVPRRERPGPLGGMSRCLGRWCSGGEWTMGRAQGSGGAGWQGSDHTMNGLVCFAEQFRFHLGDNVVFKLSLVI